MIKSILAYRLMVSIFVLFKLCVSIVKEQKKELMLSNDKLKNRDLTNLNELSK